MERFYDRMLEMENEIVQLTRNSIDSHNKKLEQAAANLNYAVSGFLNKNQAILTKRGNELQRGVKQFSFRKEHELSNLRHQIISTVMLGFAVSKTRLEQKRRDLKYVVNESLLKKHAEIVHFKDLITGQTKKMLFREQERIHFHENTARLINPVNVLKRGYTLTLKEGRIVKSTKQININEEIETRFADGSVKSKIVKKDSNDH